MHIVSKFHNSLAPPPILWCASSRTARTSDTASGRGRMPAGAGVPTPALSPRPIAVVPAHSTLPSHAPVASPSAGTRARPHACSLPSNYVRPFCITLLDHRPILLLMESNWNSMIPPRNASPLSRWCRLMLKTHSLAVTRFPFASMPGQMRRRRVVRPPPRHPSLGCPCRASPNGCSPDRRS